jgi:hypothetical protein
MKTKSLFIIFLSPLICCALPIDGNIQTRQLDADSFELTITTTQTTDIHTAQEVLIPTAKKVCGSKEPQFGHYKFNSTEKIKGTSNEKPSTLTLNQEIKCGVAEVQAQAEPSTKHWQPTEKDQSKIEESTYKYFQDRDQARYQNAYLMFSKSMQSSVTLDSWQSHIKQFNDKVGKVLKRQIIKVTWYSNPPSSPSPGVYAAVDYISQFDNVNIHCGYVAWQQAKNGEFLIVREEENYIDKITQTGMKEYDLTKLKQQFGCNTL